MPIYEYACRDCDHRFEELVSSSGTTIIACPECTSDDVQKLFSTFSAKFVGGDMPRMSGGGGGCCGGGCGWGGHGPGRARAASGGRRKLAGMIAVEADTRRAELARLTAEWSTCRA